MVHLSNMYVDVIYASFFQKHYKFLAILKINIYFHTVHYNIVMPKFTIF